MRNSNTQSSGANELCWGRAAFPIVMSACALACFVAVYYSCTANVVNPLYLWGLLFAIPWLSFAAIAVCAARGRLGKTAAAVTTGVLIPIFLFLSLGMLIVIDLSNMTSTTTNVSHYQRAMRISNSSSKEHLRIFPDQIPEGASDVRFFYSYQAWLDISETAVLRFTADAQTIQGIKRGFDHYPTQSLHDSAITRMDGWRYVGDEGVEHMPDDYKSFVVIDKTLTRAVVSISQSTNTVIFYGHYFTV